MPAKHRIPWGAQPRQAELIKAAGLWDAYTIGGPPTRPVADRIGYGGAAFGGKTDGLLGLAAIAQFAFPGCRIGFFRRTFPELEGAAGAIERSLELFSGFGEYNSTAHRWIFPTRSRLYFNHVQREDDKFNYQSQAFDILLFDEATHFTWPIIDYLLTRNRASGDIPGLHPFAVFATNPGNVGHVWFSQLFDVLEEDGPHETVKRRRNQSEQYATIYFIPAFIRDNPIGLDRDPEYPDRLRQSDPETAKALEEGDWTVFAGQMFREWRRSRHTIDPIDLPAGWLSWRSLDYGFVHPFANYWWAKDPDIGRLYVTREIVQAGLTDRQQAQRIKDMTLPEEEIAYTFASPDMWATKNYKDIVTSAADEYKAAGVILTRADNDRLNGVKKIHRLLADLPDGKPGVLIFNTCKELARVMPTLIRDDNNPEDVKKVDGDDPYDGFRYGLTKYKLDPTQAEWQRQQARKAAPMQSVGVL